MENRTLWYTRRGQVVRGPFPDKSISRFLLLGRLTLTDELSKDQNEWILVSDLKDLHPIEWNLDPSDPETEKKILVSKMREDERQGIDRRTLPRDDKRGTFIDRRQSETSEVIHRRLIKHEIMESEKIQFSRPTLLIGGLVAFVLLIFIAGIVTHFYNPPKKINIDCGKISDPKVNWSNCKLEGINLNKIDIKGSVFQNTNLYNAEIVDVKISHSNLAYSNWGLSSVKNTDFTQSNLKGTSFRNAYLNTVNFKNADLSYAIFQDTRLINVNFKEADLSNADFTNAKITNSNFDGALLDNVIWVDQRICNRGSVGKCNVESVPLKN